MVNRAAFLGRSVALSTSALLVPSALRAAAADAPAVINVGAIPLDTIGTVYYALDLGYFKNAGLTVNIQTMPGGPQAAAALAAGAIDVSVGPITTVALAHLHGVDFKYIAPAAIITGHTLTDPLMVAIDSTITKGADLNGKTIGISGLKSMQQVSAMSWVDTHGGDAKSLKFVELPFPQMGQALVQHRVDAVTSVEPFASSFKGIARSLGNVLDGIAPTFMELGYFAPPAWLQANPATANRFVAALRQAAIWANTHQKESAEILVRYAKLDPAVVSTMARATYGTTLSASMIQPVIDASAKYDVIDKTFPASELIWQAPRS
jgi:NitT/TauT family transport system substrate-binding protein